ncbi:MAG TPA: PepSY domain-containing protein, partial [Bordetella sp.]
MVSCVTGLPLVFEDEIKDWLDPPRYADLPESAPRASVDRLVAEARRLYPDNIVASVFVDDDEPQVFVLLVPSWEQAKADPASRHVVRFDAHTGAVLEQSKPPGQQRQTFLGLMLHLHRDLFADLPGELFLG